MNIYIITHLDYCKSFIMAMGGTPKKKPEKSLTIQDILGVISKQYNLVLKSMPSLTKPDPFAWEVFICPSKR